MGLFSYLRRKLSTQQLKELGETISSKADQAIAGQNDLKKVADQTIYGQQQLKDACDSISSKIDQAVEKQQELGRKADQALAEQQRLKGAADSIIEKAEQGLKARQQLKDACDGISSKIDQAIEKQQELGKHADQAMAVQQQLKGAADSIAQKAAQGLEVQQQLKEACSGISLRIDQAIQKQLELGNKTDQSLAALQEQKKLSDQAIAAQQEVCKKADLALSGQKLHNETAAAAKVRLDQIAAGQKQCVNETEFARMSRTLFAEFRYWEDNFYNAIKGIDIEEKYDRLVSGLEDEERIKVDAIIGRIQYLCEKGDKTCFLPDEAERIYRNRKESRKIVKLNDHCFVYNNFKLPINVFEMSTFTCNYGLDLIDHPEYADGRDIIDAGAYIGDSALVFDRFFSKCRRIYAFEPDPKSYALMEKTIAMNKATNIVPVGLAVGDANSEGELAGHGMGSNLLNRKSGQEQENDRTVRIVRLDDYVKGNSIEPGVIKTDLEGFEMHFLRGALETIRKYRPIMVLSIYHSADDFFGIKPFIESLDLGYRFRIFKADDGMILGGTCLICIPEP